MALLFLHHVPIYDPVPQVIGIAAMLFWGGQLGPTLDFKAVNDGLYHYIFKTPGSVQKASASLGGTLKTGATLPALAWAYLHVLQ